MQAGLLKRAARWASARARPTALPMPWPRGPAQSTSSSYCSSSVHPRKAKENAPKPLRPLKCCCFSSVPSVSDAFFMQLVTSHQLEAFPAPFTFVALYGTPSSPIRLSNPRLGKRSSQLTRRHLHSRSNEVLWVTWGLGAPLAEGLDVVNLRRKETVSSGFATRSDFCLLTDTES